MNFAKPFWRKPRSSSQEITGGARTSGSFAHDSRPKDAAHGWWSSFNPVAQRSSSPLPGAAQTGSAGDAQGPARRDRTKIENARSLDPTIRSKWSTKSWCSYANRLVCALRSGQPYAVQVHSQGSPTGNESRAAAIWPLATFTKKSPSRLVEALIDRLTDDDSPDRRT